MKKLLVALAISASMILTACGSSNEAEVAEVEDTTEIVEETNSLVDVALADPALSTLVVALQAADLVDTLAGNDQFTVFAPSDEAFAALPEGLLDQLLLPENVDVLVQILTYHVVQGGVFSVDVVPGEVATVEGSLLNLDTKSGVTVNGANVIFADLEASNGVIHIIDQVLLPPNLDLSTLK
jgi:uncharacterized surface protein with fasciclin (FAS1) repeats